MKIRETKGEDFFSHWESELLDTWRASGESCLVGVSGGVDSMVLLDLLAGALGDRIIVCHVNHELRGEESDGDELLVKEEANRRGLRFVSERGDVNAMAARDGVSVELAAREFRRRCFIKWGKEYQASFLLLAHHANDQAETVMFHLCRGGGARGIADRSRLNDDLTVIRPLLSVTRQEIVAYAEEKGIKWREDSTNAKPVATRNRIRLEVLPLLQDIMGRSVVEKIALAGQLENDRALALAEAIECMNLLDPQERLYLPKVLVMREELRRAVIHWYLKKKEVHDVSYELVKEVDALLHSAGKAKINLPGGGFARRKEKRLIIELCQ